MKIEDVFNKDDTFNNKKGGGNEELTPSKFLGEGTLDEGLYNLTLWRDHLKINTFKKARGPNQGCIPPRKNKIFIKYNNYMKERKINRKDTTQQMKVYP